MSEAKADAPKKKSKKKLLVPIILLLVVGVGYKLKFAPKPPPPPKPKIEGMVVALEKEFVVNLADGHYGKLSIGLVLKADGGGHAAADESPLVQEAVVRSIITDELTGLEQDDLISKDGREEVLGAILKRIKKETDEHVEEIVFTDLAVQ
jgi:flagellar basal body-associated protein FliL